jgi:sRNA-binding carbon storage regulator CsrA
MLFMDLGPEDRIILMDRIIIQIERTKGKRCRISIDAPTAIPIRREQKNKDQSKQMK